jgi:hypothetical protein
MVRPPSAPVNDGRANPSANGNGQRLDQIAELRALALSLHYSGWPRDPIITRVNDRDAQLGRPHGDPVRLVEEVLGPPRRPVPDRERESREQERHRREGERLVRLIEEHAVRLQPVLVPIFRALLAAELPAAVDYLLRSHRKRRGGAA